MEEKVIESEFTDRMRAPLEVPEEQVLHKLINVQADLEELAGGLAFAENLKRAHGGVVEKPAAQAEATTDANALIALIRESLNNQKGRSDITPVLAFIAVVSEEFEAISDRLEERRQEGDTVPEKHLDYAEEHIKKLHSLFNLSIGMKRFSDTDAEDLSLWIANEAHQLEALDALPADDQKRSDIRGLLPVFQRFREGQETKNDLDLLLGEIENKRHSELCELKEMLLAYARSKDEMARIHMNEYLEKVVMLRHFDRKIRRKQLGE